MVKCEKSPLFVPLSPASQAVGENVLFFNANASMDAVYECANARLQAIINLLDMLHEFKSSSPNNAAVVSSMASFLLNDANTLFEELSGLALSYDKSQSDV